MLTPPLPHLRDASVVPFLEENGLISITPPVRSSYYSSALSNPFFFYLGARLGISSAFKDSDALSRGSWFHTAAETSDHDPLTHPIAYFDILRARQRTLQHLCTSMRLPLPFTSRVLGREELDAHTAWAWWTAHLDIPLPSPFGSVRTFLSQPYWQLLGRELVLKVPGAPGCPPRHITIDALYYHADHKKLWLLDYKTTALLPTIRLSVCPDDFQTAHYLSVTTEALRTGLLDKLLHAASINPTSISVGGMMHVAIQKPSIKFGESDRPYRTVEFTPTRGKNKGITRLEREYLDEPPSLNNFVRRVKEYLTATGDYTHLAAERTEPPVNISFSPTSQILEGHHFSTYNARLSFLNEMLTRPAYPSAFLSNPADYTARGSLTPFATFALLPVREWPRLMSEHHLTVQRRDTETPPEEPTDE